MEMPCSRAAAGERTGTSSNGYAARGVGKESGFSLVSPPLRQLVLVHGSGAGAGSGNPDGPISICPN